MQTGPLEITNGTAPSGTIIQAPGFLILYSGATASNVNIVNGSAQVYPGATISGLELAGTAAIADLAGLAYIPSATVTLDDTTDILAISGGGATETVQLAGDYSKWTVGVESDYGILTFDPTHPGTDIYLTPATNGSTPTPTTSPPSDGATHVDGQNNTVRIESGTVITSAGPNTEVLGSGPCTVQSNGADTIFGGTGTDNVTLTGGATVVGGAGAMTVQGGAGNSTVFGGTGGLTYTGGSGYDIVVGLGNPMTVQGGSGGGQYWGSGGSTIMAGTGATAVLVGSGGDRLYSAGAAGDFLVATGGDVLLSGAASAGNDVMIGAGTGALAFIAGSGNDLIGMGSGTNAVALGAGHDTVFANGTTTISSGSGSADIVLGGSTTLTVTAGASAAQNFALFNFVPGADIIHLQGFAAAAASNALATQTYAGGVTTLTLAPNTTVSLMGVQHAGASVFG